MSRECTTLELETLRLPGRMLDAEEPGSRLIEPGLRSREPMGASGAIPGQGRSRAVVAALEKAR